jgi:hypothetical protein
MAPPKKIVAATKPRTKATATSEQTPPPNWPPFKPLLPTSDLSLITLVEYQILLIHNFWTSTLCKNYVSFLKTLPLTTTPGRPKRDEALRVNDRFSIDDPGFANRLWVETGLRELVCGIEEGKEDGGERMTKEERERLW